MVTKKDIEARTDIENLIIQFYQKVLINPVIGFIFTDVVKLDIAQHIPVIVDFWETILLDNPVYKKNAMEVHFDLNKKIPLQKKHFSEWVLLFCTTVDELFVGKIATLAKSRARSIASIMELKMIK